VCRSFDHFITNNKQLVFKTSLFYERQVGGALSSGPTTSFAVSVGKAPQRLPQASRLSSSLPVPVQYKNSTAACSPSAASSLIHSGTQHDFLRPLSVLAEIKGAEWSQIDSGITIVDFTMGLDLDILVLFEHSPPLQ